jgi:hypothetical protein
MCFRKRVISEKQFFIEFNIPSQMLLVIKNPLVLLLVLAKDTEVKGFGQRDYEVSCWRWKEYALMARSLAPRWHSSL